MKTLAILALSDAAIDTICETVLGLAVLAVIAVVAWFTLRDK